MEQKLSVTAENLYQQYQECDVIVAEHLFAWLLAEVHFASSVTKVQSTVLGASPVSDHEVALLIETAHAYRNYRRAIDRKEKVILVGDIQAVRAKEP